MSKLVVLGLNDIVEELISAIEIESLVFTDSLQSAKSNSGIETVVASKDNLDERISEVSISESDLVISVGCPWILNKETLQKLGNRVLNLHGTHLPTYRGGTIYSWYLLNRRRIGICTLHKMTEDIDAGGIVDFKEYIIPVSCRKPVDFMNMYLEENVAFLKTVIDKWQKGEHPHDKKEIQQPEYLSSYWPRLLTQYHGWIDWNWKGYDIEAFCCAFDDPYDGAHTNWNSQKVFLKDVYFQPGQEFHPFQNGLVYRKTEGWLVVAVAGGELLIQKVNLESGENIFDKIKVGDRFFTSHEDLENHAVKVIKTSQGLVAKK